MQISEFKGFISRGVGYIGECIGMDTVWDYWANVSGMYGREGKFLKIEVRKNEGVWIIKLIIWNLVQHLFLHIRKPCQQPKILHLFGFELLINKIFNILRHSIFTCRSALGHVNIMYFNVGHECNRCSS